MFILIVFFFLILIEKKGNIRNRHEQKSVPRIINLEHNIEVTKSYYVKKILVLFFFSNVNFHLKKFIFFRN